MKTNKDFGENAVWITCPEQKEPLLGGRAATYFRKKFYIDGSFVPRSDASVAALGLFALFVNGKKANSDVLALPFTNYNKTVLYNKYDITDFLRRGENEIEIVVGDGWCNQNAPDEWGFSRASWKTVNKMIFSARVGDKEIVSDECWDVCSDGPVYRSALRLGEFHDNNLTPSYSFRAEKCAPPLGKLVKNTMHEIRECEELKPLSVSAVKKGFLLDFGRNIAGYLRFEADGRRGKTVTATYGDKLKSGRIDNKFNSRYITDKAMRKYFQVDKLTLSRGKNEFKPLFAYHGFRYAYIEGLSETQAKNATAIAVRNSFERTGEFSCSLPRLDKLQNMCLASSEANFVGIPTDCPHREKNGWTGDVWLSAEQMLYNFDCAADLKKYLGDICDCQLENGCIPCIAPTAENIFGYDWGNGPVWDLALFEIPYRLALHRNDFSAAKRYLPNLEKYYAYLQTRQRGDGLYEFGLGAPKEMRKDATPLALVASLSALQMTRIMKFFHGEFFGSDGGYAEKETALTKAIRRKFVKRGGKVANNTVCALAGILHYDLATDNEKDAIFSALLEKLRECGYTMQFGILGNKYLYRVLFKFGRADIALKMFENDSYPSFGHWINQGAVTLWEDFGGVGSRNHYMFSDISAVFYKYFAGISYEFVRGVQHNTVRLVDLPQIKSVRAKLRTPNGILQIEKQTTQGFAEYTLSVPADSVTCVIYPSGISEQLPPNKIYKFSL